MRRGRSGRQQALGRPPLAVAAPLSYLPSAMRTDTAPTTSLTLRTARTAMMATRTALKRGQKCPDRIARGSA
jgi:hypothetical protein